MNANRQSLANRQDVDYEAAILAMQTGTYTGQGDLFDWELWDRFTIDGTTPVTTHRLFVNGLGSPGGVLGNRNLSDTNLVGNQGLPLGQKMFVRAIAFYYLANAVADNDTRVAWHDMLADTTLNIAIPGKDTYGQWGLDSILGIPVSMVGVPAATNYNPSESTGRYPGIKPINLPITLSSQVAFTVEVVHHNGTPDPLLDDHIVKIGLVGALLRLS